MTCKRLHPLHTDKSLSQTPFKLEIIKIPHPRESFISAASRGEPKAVNPRANISQCYLKASKIKIAF